MKALLKITIAFTLILVSQLASASVYTTYNPYGPYGQYSPRTEAWSTVQYCQFDVYNVCHLANPRIAIKYDQGADAGRWIILPTFYALPAGVNADINWAVNYVIQNNLPWRWGNCLQTRTVYNVTDCVY